MIAKTLAELEASESVTPASKLMLAMPFEDQVFKAAASLADYHKKINKRMKKLRKTFAPKSAATAKNAPAAASTGSGAPGNSSPSSSFWAPSSPAPAPICIPIREFLTACFFCCERKDPSHAFALLLFSSQGPTTSGTTIQGSAVASRRAVFPGPIWTCQRHLSMGGCCCIVEIIVVVFQLIAGIHTFRTGTTMVNDLCNENENYRILTRTGN